MSYVVKLFIELEAESEREAEDLVLGLDIANNDGESIPCYVEVEEVKKLNENSTV